ncbi:MAG: MBL fold metallo-hydrolase [Acidobacteria bacterium]|nr:MBL fold metallo-hydrolase [Acidobacteriota bacterium]
MLPRLHSCFGAFSFVVSVSAAPDFTIERIARRLCGDPDGSASLWFNPNTVIIVGKRFVTVVDTNISGAYTRDVLAALRKITRKPVRYVVNTHWRRSYHRQPRLSRRVSRRRVHRSRVRSRIFRRSARRTAKVRSRTTRIRRVSPERPSKGRKPRGQ